MVGSKLQNFRKNRKLAKNADFTLIGIGFSATFWFFGHFGILRLTSDLFLVIFWPFLVKFLQKLHIAISANPGPRDVILKNPDKIGVPLSGMIKLTPLGHDLIEIEPKLVFSKTARSSISTRNRSCDFLGSQGRDLAKRRNNFLCKLLRRKGQKRA